MKLHNGQVAVITGAASGIGLALARAFARRGLGVMLADIDGDSLAAAEADIRTLGGNAQALRTDVTRTEDVEALEAATRARFGRYDIVCNNAGVAPPPAPLWEHELAAWRWAIDVILLGTVNGVRAFVPGLIAQGSGHVVNTASLAGLAPLPLVGPYSAAKYAVVGLSECLADELARDAPGVGVSVLCPGMVDTSLAMTSARNRPDVLASTRFDVTSSPALQVLHERSGELLSADCVATMTIDAIEQNRMHIYTHGDLHRRIRRQAFGDDDSARTEDRAATHRPATD